jgi:hypoxia up-regulated 1
VPKVQEILKAGTKVDLLNVHLNGDEGMAFGAAFIAANNSAAYKVRKVFLTQHPEFDIKVKISPLNETNGGAAIQVVEGET